MRCRPIVCFAAAAVALTATILAGPAGGVSYTQVGSSFSADDVWGFNDSRQIVYTKNDRAFFRDTASGAVDMGTPIGSRASLRTINADGTAAGFYGLPNGEEHVFTWSLTGGFRDRGLLDPTFWTYGSNAHGSMADVNTHGQAVGYKVATDGLKHAILWDNGAITELGTLAQHTMDGDTHGDASFATAINEVGQIVGSSNLDPGGTSENAFLWWGGAMISLWTFDTFGGGNPPGPWYATDISNSGYVTGWWQLVYDTDWQYLMNTATRETDAWETQLYRGGIVLVALNDVGHWVKEVTDGLHPCEYSLEGTAFPAMDFSGLSHLPDRIPLLNNSDDIVAGIGDGQYAVFAPEPPAPTPPTVTIASPTNDASYLTIQSTVDLSGTTSDNVEVASVTWSSDRGGSGSCTGTTSWTAVGVALQEGLNVVTVTATNTAGQTGTDMLTITYDPTQPTVSISGPTAEPTYLAMVSTIPISGTASDNIGVTSVSWSNDRGGSGTCDGTETWSASGVPLQLGDNLITVIALDAAGNSATDTLTVTRKLSMADAKQPANDKPVSLEAKVVTYASANFFYIEEDSRCMGIRVEKTAHGLTVGMRADVTGTTKTGANRERYILATNATQTAAPNATGTVAPIAMRNDALGGSDWHVVGTGGQKGTTNSLGLNNVGLLVRTYGRYEQIDATTFTVDDGSGLFIKCTVPPGTYLNSGWQFVSVTGISSIYKPNSITYWPNILVRDIGVLLPRLPDSPYTGG